MLTSPRTEDRGDARSAPQRVTRGTSEPNQSPTPPQVPVTCATRRSAISGVTGLSSSEAGSG
jgi:hypothetical protein